LVYHPPSFSRDTKFTFYLEVGLKYITKTQVVEVTYEGKQRSFSVSSVSSASESKANSTDVTLSNEFKNLASISRPQIWIAGWNTRVVLDDPSQVSSVEVRRFSICETNIRLMVKILQGPIEELAHKPEQEAYAAVGGLDSQISQIRDLLEIPLTRPDLFRHFGLKPPKGILLHGPPGTGKTHLARAIASATNSSVLVINGPELSSAYHGETESKLRSVFEEAKTKSPCIVVLDEIDALVPKREEGGGGEVEKRVVATLLTLLDGMDEEEDGGKGHVVVIGTTNRPNAIDPALRRPGRFDKEFEIGKLCFVLIHELSS
jgi:AAA family ATPase